VFQASLFFLRFFVSSVQAGLDSKLQRVPSDESTGAESPEAEPPARPSSDFLRSKRQRITSALNCKPLRRVGCEFPSRPLLKLERHRAIFISRRSTSEAHVFAQDSCSRSMKTVGVFSTILRKRNHTFKGTRRTLAIGRSLRSSATSPNPPPCSNRSAARNACSILLQRTRSNLPRATPASCAPQGSNESRPSTSAHDSSRLVSAESREMRRLVRPEPTGPEISVRHPRGRPPVSWSISGMPQATISAGAAGRGEKGAGILLPRDFSSWARKADVFTGITMAKKDRKRFLFSLLLRLARILPLQPVLVNSRISMHCCLHCLVKVFCKLHYPATSWIVLKSATQGCRIGPLLGVLPQFSKTNRGQ